MSYRKVAKSVAKEYIETHEDSDREFVHLVCYDAAERYDTSGSKLSLESFITLQLRNAIIVAKQRVQEMTKENEMAYNRTSDKDKEEILQELLKGDDPKDVAIRHDVKQGTLNAMISRWRESGKLPPKTEKHTSIQDAIAACEPKAVRQEPVKVAPPPVEITGISPAKPTVTPSQPKQEMPVEDIPPVQAPFKICSYLKQVVKGATLVASQTNNETGLVCATYKNKDGKRITVTISEEE